MRACNSLSRRLGLTLMELVVVLVILVALAGILIPMLPSMIGRAHTASGAANDSSVTQFVQMYEQLYQEYPSGFDLLNDGSSTALPDYLPAAGGLITFKDLTAGQADALKNAGITELAPMFKDRASMTAGASVTFDPYTSATNVPVASGLKVAILDEATVEKTLVTDPTDPTGTNGDVYVVLGLGKRSSMMGKVISQAPVHFGEGKNDNAANVYSRFGLVFRVTRGGATPADLEKAIFLGTISLHDDNFVGTDGHLQEYYNITKSQ